MNRRSLLRGVAVAGAGGGATLAGVAVASDEATGQTQLALAVAGDSTTLAPDVQVTAVRLSLDVDWRYELPDLASPETVVVEIAAGTDALTVVASAETVTLFTESDGSESFDVELIDAGALGADALAPESGERETTVTVEARLRVADAAGDVVARETTTDTAPVTVTRGVDASAGVGGSGSLSIETGSE